MTANTKWQWSLRSILLATLMAASWLTLLRLHTAIPKLEVEIRRMEVLLPSRLVIEDPKQLTVAHLDPTWFDENVWDLHVPKGHRYQLMLATREIGERGLTKPAETTQLASGRHRIEIIRTEKRNDRWFTQVLIDEKPQLSADEPLEWNAGRGSRGGSKITDSTSYPTTDEVVLFRRRWSVQTSDTSFNAPQGPGNGLLLWLSPQPDGED